MYVDIVRDPICLLHEKGLGKYPLIIFFLLVVVVTYMSTKILTKTYPMEE